MNLRYLLGYSLIIDSAKAVQWDVLHPSLVSATESLSYRFMVVIDKISFSVLQYCPKHPLDRLAAFSVLSPALLLRFSSRYLKHWSPFRVYVVVLLSSNVAGSYDGLLTSLCQVMEPGRSEKVILFPYRRDNIPSTYQTRLGSYIRGAFAARV